MAPIVWTTFPSQYASRIETHSGSFLDLALAIRNAGPFVSKDAAPWLKLARFGDKLSPKNSYRTNDNVLEVHGLEGDYDGGTISIEDAVATLERHKIRALLYPSASAGPGKHRWRVIAPLAEPASPGRRYQLMTRLNGALGGILADESFVLSQSYYYGRVHGAHRYGVWLTEGTEDEDNFCIDQLDSLDSIAIGKRVKAPEQGKHVGLSMFEDAVAQAGRKLRTGDGRRALLKTYVASRSAKGLTAYEVVDLVDAVVQRYFDPADPPVQADIDQVVRHFAAKDADKAKQPTEVALPSALAPPQDEILLDHVGTMLEDIKAIRWLVHGWLEQDAISMMFGPPAGGKSFVAIDLSACVATGLPWHGHDVTKGGVYYVAGEGHNGIMRRFAAWSKERGTSLAHAPLFKTRRAVMILNESEAIALAEHIARMVEKTGIPPLLIVIDTLARNYGDGDENKQQDASRFIEHVDRHLRKRWNCHVLIVHHSGHAAERARGSSVFKAAVDQELQVRPLPGATLLLGCTKMKDAEPPPELTFAIKQVELAQVDDLGAPVTGAVLEPTGDPFAITLGKKTDKKTDLTAREVIDMLRNEGWPGNEVASMRLSFSNPTRAMTKLLAMGYVDASGATKNRDYTVSEKAMSMLSVRGADLPSALRDEE